MSTTFDELGLDPGLTATLHDLGYAEPTPIQAATIPALLEGDDVLGQAATGTGKTAAFALPILQRIGDDAPAVPTALIIAPTRELAVQVSEAVDGYSRGMGIKVLAVFGGQPINIQLKALRRGVHVVVATPGRAVDLMKRSALDLDAIEVVVLDEADEMLDMGFAEELEAILDATPPERQTVLFSATMPRRIAKIAERYQRDPVHIEVAKEDSADAAALIDHRLYAVKRRDRAAALGRIIDAEQPEAAIVFCRTRQDVDAVAVTMNGRGARAEPLHGGMDQAQRDRVMARLRDGTVQLLIATDVAARGLDIDTLTHVVNFDVPASVDTYVHRVGRVGRAGKSGVAITLAEPRDRRQIGNIEHRLGRTFDRPELPSVDDVRRRQRGLTADAVLAAMTDDDLDDYSEMFEDLLERGGGGAERVALAALKLLADERGTVDANERDIATVEIDAKRDRRDRPKSSDRGGHRPDSETGYVHVNLGRRAGVRPGDLVGAIANEADLPGSEIGPIKILDHSSIVGVPEDRVDQVTSAMGGAEIRGQKARFRRFEERRRGQGPRDRDRRPGKRRDRGR